MKPLFHEWEYMIEPLLDGDYAIYQREVGDTDWERYSASSTMETAEGALRNLIARRRADADFATRQSRERRYYDYNGNREDG